MPSYTESTSMDKSKSYGAALLAPGNEHQTRPSMLLIHLSLVLVYAFWGGGAFVSKFGIHESSPLVFEMIAEALSAPLMLMFAVWMGGRLRPDRRDIPVLFLSAVFFVAAQSCYFIGLKHLSASMAATYQTLFPVFATLLAVLAGQEQSTCLKWVAIVLAVSGAFVMALGSLIHAMELNKPLAETLIGHFLFFAQMQFLSAFVVCSKKLSLKYGGSSVTGWLFILGACLFFLVHTCFSMNDSLHGFMCTDESPQVMQACLEAKIGIPNAMIIPLLYEVFCCSLGGWMILNWANKYADASVVSIYCVVQPTVAMFISIIFILAEGQAFADKYEIRMPGEYKWGGLAIIVVGLSVIFWQDYRGSKENAAADQAEEAALVPENSRSV